MPLANWYLAIYPITQTKINMAALELRRHLGSCWRAGWLLKHKIMGTMRRREAERSLSGGLRIDDAYLGGERTGGGPGRASENKVPFVAAVQMREGCAVRAHFEPVEKNISFAALTGWAERVLASGCRGTSDDLLGFEVLERLGHQHDPVTTPRRHGKAGTDINPPQRPNTVLGNLRTALPGTHHAFDFRKYTHPNTKYAHRYLAKVGYRFNRRYDLAAMVTAPRPPFAC